MGDLDTVVMDSLLDLSPTEAHKVWADGDPLKLNLRLKLMPNLDITVMDLTDTTLDLTDTVFLDVALPTLEVTTWERDLLKLMLNPDIMDLTDTTLDLTDILMDLMDIVLMDVVLLLTLLVTLSPTEASKDLASKCAKSGVF